MPLFKRQPEKKLTAYAAALEFQDRLDAMIAAARKAGVHPKELERILDERSVAVASAYAMSAPVI